VKNLEQCRLLVKRIKRYKGRLVRLQGVKLAVDGYALMYNIPPEHGHMAIPMHPQSKFEQIIATIHQAGFQADVHAVGDKGVDWTLAAFAKAAGGAAGCRKRRHRIEHFPFRKSDSIKRAAELGVPVCLQPNFIEVKADDFYEKLGRISREYIDNMLPVNTFAREGVQIAYGADVPAFPSYAPMDSIRSAMERQTSSGRKLASAEAVSFMKALGHHTIGGAYAAFDEKEIGSLETGKYADFVIWNRDLAAVRTGGEAAALEPEATYLAGKAVYERA
jgi:predicted amidohydrolase YtcJ